MRPSIALRANCASWPCVLCTLPKTSPESASNACSAPATVWLSTAMMSGLETGPPVEGRRNRPLISCLRHFGKSEAGTGRAAACRAATSSVTCATACCAATTRSTACIATARVTATTAVSNQRQRHIVSGIAE